MIRYTLTCEHAHRFDSWFQSAAAFDRLQGARMVTCALCGSTVVQKALMAPAVAAKHASDSPADLEPQEKLPSLSTPQTPAEKMIAEMRRRIEAESDYVGLSFAAEARAIHDGDSPARPIGGEAKPDEARALVEDGVPVVPLPFRPRSRQN